MPFWNYVQPFSLEGPEAICRNSPAMGVMTSTGSLYFPSKHSRKTKGRRLEGGSGKNSGKAPLKPWQLGEGVRGKSLDVNKDLRFQDILPEVTPIQKRNQNIPKPCPPAIWTLSLPWPVRASQGTYSASLRPMLPFVMQYCPPWKEPVTASPLLQSPGGGQQQGHPTAHGHPPPHQGS